MNGIEKITARIEADTKAEIDEILKQAEDRAKQIRLDYEAKAAAEEKAAAEAGAQAAKERAERLESAAHMEAKQMMLRARQECMDQAFERARHALLQLPEEDYIGLLAKIAAGVSQNGKEEILLNAGDRERVGAQVVSRANAMTDPPKALTLAKETRDIEGGLILRSGNIEVNCAFETQLRILRENMAAQVAGILFA